LTNLLENAAKYSPAESSITLSASRTTLADIMDLLPLDQQDPVLLVEQGASPLVLIRVKDHGEGVLPGDRDLIFDKFVRAPRSLTTPVRGSGLGLYICRRYVEAMGGKLWLEQSIPNKGSVFTFYLPYVEPLVEAREQVTGEYKTL
jgi:signal transduction histidine kinase